jgi:benzodiazapine receptor
MAMFTRSLQGSETAIRVQRLRPSPNAVGFGVFLVLCAVAGVVGSAFADTGAGSWYDGIDKPSFTPPTWVFPPMWGVLYAAMAFGAWRVWRRIGPEPDRSRALVVFGVQLLLNALWTPVFFGAESPYLGLLVVAALWLAVLAMVLTFAPVDPVAAVVNVPYLLWVSFAFVLNGVIAVMQ